MNTINATQSFVPAGEPVPSKVAELLVLRDGSTNAAWAIDLQQFDFSLTMNDERLVVTAQRNKGDLRYWQMHEEIDLECTLKTDKEIWRFKAQMGQACEREIPGKGRYQSAAFSILGPIVKEQLLDFTP